jgi:hypothetical protein
MLVIVQRGYAVRPEMIACLLAGCHPRATTGKGRDDSCAVLPDVVHVFAHLIGWTWLPPSRTPSKQQEVMTAANMAV